MWSNLFLRVKVTVLSQPNQKATEKHDTRATQYPRGCNSLLTHEACDVFTSAAQLKNLRIISATGSSQERL